MATLNNLRKNAKTGAPNYAGTRALVSQLAVFKTMFAAPAFNQAPVRQNNANYKPGDALALPTGELVMNSTAGQSSGVAPVLPGTPGPMIDGGCTWWHLAASTRAAPTNIPGATYTDNAGASGLTLYTFLANPGLFERRSASNLITVAGNRSQAWNINEGSTNNNGYPAGFEGLLGRYRTEAFRTAATTIDVGYFATSSSYLNERLMIWVDGNPLTEVPIIPAAFGGSRYLRIVLADTVKKKRTIRIASAGIMNLLYVAVGAGETVEPTSRPAPTLFMSTDSIGDTESPSITNCHYDLTVRVAQGLGFPNVVFAGLGGTSYSLDSGGRKSLRGLIELNDFGKIPFDAAVFGQGYNAPANAVPVATEVRDFDFCMRRMRDLFDGPIVPILPWYRRPGLEANYDSLVMAMIDQFLKIGDQNSGLVSPFDDSVILGDGTVIRHPSQSWINATNVAWALPPTGGLYDGAHPPVPGQTLIVSKTVSGVGDVLNGLAERAGA